MRESEQVTNTPSGSAACQGLEQLALGLEHLRAELMDALNDLAILGTSCLAAG